MKSFFNNQYYKWNKRCLSCSGLWPEQSLFMRCFMPSLIILILISIMIPEMTRVKNSWPDVDVLMDCLSPFFVMAMGIAQILNGGFNRKEFLRMLDHVTSDWTRMRETPNIEILHKYATRGCKITITYSAWMYSAAVFYTLTPVAIPVIIDAVTSSNTTREKVYLFEAEYGVNSDDYYWPILGHMFLTSYAVILAAISSDVMYFAMVEHACGLFEIAGMNLRMVHSETMNDTNSTDDRSYKMICHCMQLHREAIVFASIIESSYSISCISVIGCSLMILSVTGIQTLMHLDEPGECLRYGSFAIAQIFHLYFNSVPGQKLMDYSLSIFDYAYSLNWYDLTPKSQKLLIIIMLRSMRPCQINAGKIYVVSMENFSSVMQTSMSCFTVLSSMR